jgi:NIMA (never in mitosis gene a)-related kinase
MRLADFKVIKFLGKGSYGSVYKVVRISDSTEYAMKEVKIKYMNQVEREEAVNEVRLLASVKHPLVIRYCESFYEADKLYIVV